MVGTRWCGLCQRTHERGERCPRAFGPREADQRRPPAAERGYDWQWKRLRDWYIAQHPLCEECGQAPAVDVHHIRPVREVPEGKLEVANLRALCRRCHRRLESVARDDGI